MLPALSATSAWKSIVLLYGSTSSPPGVSSILMRTESANVPFVAPSLYRSPRTFNNRPLGSSVSEASPSLYAGGASVGPIQVPVVDDTELTVISAVPSVVLDCSNYLASWGFTT